MHPYKGEITLHLKWKGEQSEFGWFVFHCFAKFIQNWKRNFSQRGHFVIIFSNSEHILYHSEVFTDWVPVVSSNWVNITTTELTNKLHVCVCVCVCVTRILPGPGGLKATSLHVVSWSRTACVCTRRVAPTAWPPCTPSRLPILHRPPTGSDWGPSSWGPERGRPAGEASWGREEGFAPLWQRLWSQWEAADVETNTNLFHPVISTSTTDVTVWETPLPLTVQITSFHTTSTDVTSLQTQKTVSYHHTVNRLLRFFIVVHSTVLVFVIWSF